MVQSIHILNFKIFFRKEVAKVELPNCGSTLSSSQFSFPCCTREREGDWPLHLEAIEAMLPLFYAADHINYARDGLYYLKSMKSLPKNVCDHFMKGEHTIQHRAGVFSGIWSDMGIETSYMRFGHSSLPV